MPGFDRSDAALAALLRAPRTEHVSKPIDVQGLLDPLYQGRQYADVPWCLA
jgi:hypothetical protein